MLAHCLRCWPRIYPTIYQSFVFAVTKFAIPAHIWYISDQLVVFEVSMQICKTANMQLAFNPLTAGAAYIPVFIFY